MLSCRTFCLASSRSASSVGGSSSEDDDSLESFLGLSSLGLSLCCLFPCGLDLLLRVRLGVGVLVLTEELTNTSEGVLGVWVLLLVFSLGCFLFIARGLSLTLVCFGIVLFFIAASLTLGGSRLSTRLITIFGSSGITGVVTACRAPRT